MALEIARFANHQLLGAPGRAYLNGEFLCYTMEPPWLPHETSKGGTPYKSCVPEGIYDLVDFQSEKWGAVKALHNPALDVYAEGHMRTSPQQRFACLMFHKGNFPFSFEGCVGAGENYSLFPGLGMGITKTSETVLRVQDLIKGEKRVAIYFNHEERKNEAGSPC